MYGKNIDSQCIWNRVTKCRETRRSQRGKDSRSQSILLAIEGISTFTLSETERQCMICLYNIANLVLLLKNKNCIIAWKWKFLSHVQFFATQWTVPLSMEVNRILEWVAIPFSRGSSQPRDRTQVSYTVDRFFTIWATLCRHACSVASVTSNSLWPHGL